MRSNSVHSRVKSHYHKRKISLLTRAKTHLRTTIGILLKMSLHCLARSLQRLTQQGALQLASNGKRAALLAPS